MTTDKAVTWTVMDPAIATIANGALTGVAAGATELEAAAGDLKATATVTVNAPSPPPTRPRSSESREPPGSAPDGLLVRGAARHSGAELETYAVLGPLGEGPRVEADNFRASGSLFFARGTPKMSRRRFFEFGARKK